MLVPTFRSSATAYSVVIIQYKLRKALLSSLDLRKLLYQSVVVQTCGNLVFDWDHYKRRKSVICHGWAQDIQLISFSLLKHLSALATVTRGILGAPIGGYGGLLLRLCLVSYLLTYLLTYDILCILSEWSCPLLQVFVCNILKQTNGIISSVSREHFIDVTVEDGPRILQLASRPIYHPGDSFRCSADGNPEPTYNWKDLDNGTVTKGSVLVISEEMANDNYTFQCTATNQYNSVSAVFNFTVEGKSAMFLHHMGGLENMPRTFWSRGDALCCAPFLFGGRN